MNSNGQIFDNGPVILFIIISICNPTVRVRVESMKKKIKSVQLLILTMISYVALPTL